MATLRNLLISPWAGAGVLTAQAGGALPAGGLVLWLPGGVTGSCCHVGRFVTLVEDFWHLLAPD